MPIGLENERHGEPQRRLIECLGRGATATVYRDRPVLAGYGSQRSPCCRIYLYCLLIDRCFRVLLSTRLIHSRVRDA